MTEFVLATNNANKLREIQAQLNNSQVTFLSADQAGVPSDFDVDETGLTFAENAELKARAFAAITGKPSVADDSGLVVHSLGGQPGVHSKRWITGSDHDRNLYLLDRLHNQTDRSAEFVTVLALYYPETDQVTLFEGKVAGTISTAERGDQGFGYDPVFIPAGYQQTFAELGEDVKNTLSHRFRAVEKLKEFLISK